MKRLLLLGVTVFLTQAEPALARDPPLPAYVVADGQTGVIIDSRLASQPRHPASLAKLMTVYLAFKAIGESQARWDTTIKVSAQAALQGGSVLGLRVGDSLTVEEAVMAVIARSANDAAVALAEYLGGSEAGFASRMTEQAKKLGLMATSFKNATGLSAQGQVTTAADMAGLAMALRRDFPADYARFASRSVSWKRQQLPNLNGFLGAFTGAEGLKTGFTCPAGYNLVAAAQRDGRRIIGVVLGARSKEERESLMAQNLSRAFRGGAPKEQAASLEKASLANSLPDLSGTVCAGGIVPGDSSGNAGTSSSYPSGWALELSFARQAGKAHRDLMVAQSRLGLGGQALVVRAPFSGDVRYRGLLAGLSEESAVKSCLNYRTKGGDCLVLNPQMLKGAFEEQRRLARFIARD
ncbi:Predicted peptidase S11, D-alanyl-D-alanine carboxypeptidase 1 [Rhodospirillaceae bacterium LM-1]|nr:Predicted peptidase S11, D-alanyl-D-alanine carboxypeptidase 1 [Rhodospirillaceae bacterium LM-1]